jgi:CRP-like cAMP-binding protein
MSTLSPDFLANIRIFRGTTEEERGQLMQVMTHEEFAAGATIFASQDSDHALHVIVQGSAEVVLDVSGYENPLVEGGDAQVVDHTNISKLEIGSVFGETSFFHGGPHSATVKAVSTLETLKLSADKFREMIQHDNLAAYKIAMNAATILSERLRSADKLLGELILAQHDPLARSNWFSSHLELHTRVYD